MEVNDKLSIKTLLFTKAIPNYEIPTPVNGHKVFACTDCGDKFVFESSYNYHIHRKSVKISYLCRNCNQSLTFFNRCKLLNHIRSHAFKTATINVNDLKLDPLPLSHFKYIDKHKTNTENNIEKSPSTLNQPKPNLKVCHDCNEIIPNLHASQYLNRAHHYMQYSKELYTCPVCMFTLPTLCGFKAHIRLHLNIPPYYCPECGCSLRCKNIRYPFDHDCEGFKMMRVSTRLSCPVGQCRILHPNEFKDHMRANHMKKVYKCPLCAVACFNRDTIDQHLEEHKGGVALVFHQCDMCPGRLVLQKNIDSHLMSHATNYVYPCVKCGLVLKNLLNLFNHIIRKHNTADATSKVIMKFSEMVKPRPKKPNKSNAKPVYRVVKRCDQCKRNFTYKCKYSEIAVLPSQCPFKCSNTSKLFSETGPEIIEGHITCHICKEKISQDWEEIKKHYKKEHKNHRCLDAHVSVKRLSARECLNARKKKKKAAPFRRLRSRMPKKIESDQTDEQQTLTLSTSNAVNSNTTVTDRYSCCKCDFTSETKALFEEHIVSHRDPCMAYQCMECGQCFVVKPSFSKHLLLDHNITDVEEYISKKQCYNENALDKYQDVKNLNEPLKENQCKICRDQFENSDDLQKHFRVHGMAFLLKNTGNKSTGTEVNPDCT